MVGAHRHAWLVPIFFQHPPIETATFYVSLFIYILWKYHPFLLPCFIFKAILEVLVLAGLPFSLVLILT